MHPNESHDSQFGKESAKVTPERYQKIRALFESAIQVAPDRQKEWLRESSQGDIDLCKIVEKLLDANHLAGDEESLPQFALTIDNEPEFPKLEGKRIDNYQIIREIGRGGMGIVYLAHRADDLFSKQVAIKALRPERRDPELDKRFRRECDIIARLEHPNIARLLDAGTTEEGLPYSVMEYVEGQPINVYCDANHLNITERLKMFQTVCAAVQYAHQNLVVHRDLKPSNIFVSNDGTVKLLDFGIAKLIATDLQETQTDLSRGVQVMTPAYASPEQTTGQPVNTSSDVYSLGVILYELVTGRSPYRTKGRFLHEVAQAICEQVPLRPSEIVLQQIDYSGRFDQTTPCSREQISEIREGKPARLQRRLVGELDNIILMALRKEPQRRYGSVEQLSSDISRHLSGLPILAQKDTVRYRVEKFIKRHRIGVSSAALVVILLCAAIVVTTWQTRVAQLERSRAERQAAEAKFQSQRAEREATFAKQQLLIAEARTREAQEKDQEARQEREKATKRAQQARAISSALLDMNAESADSGSDRSSKSGVSAAEQLLASLLSEGYNDSSLRKDLATARKMLERYGGLDGTGGAPPGWSFSNPKDFETGLEKKDGAAGSIAYIRSRKPRTKGLAELLQSVDAESYLAKRIRLSSMLKSKDVELAANVFARITGKKTENLFSGKSEPSLKGTRDWNRHTIVFDVPADSAEIVIGLMLQGGGSVWADKFSFEVVDLSAPVVPAGTKAPF
jgi:eukaryotic-like serine/threonine-protein kinase